MKIKTVFIAHPISGNVEENLQKVLKICKAIHSEKILPVFPSFVWREYLNTSEEYGRHLSNLVNEEYFKRGMIDELWLYGSTLSDGIKKEIELANLYNIPVVAKSRKILRDYQIYKKLTEPGKFFERSCYSTHETFWVDDTFGKRFWIKPSDIVNPIEEGEPESTFFSGALGQAEREQTAYLICKFFKEHQNAWYPVSLKILDAYVTKHDPELTGWCHVLTKTNYTKLNNKEELLFSNMFIERCAGFRDLNEPERWKVTNVFEIKNK